jgi:carboxylesterase type B
MSGRLPHRRTSAGRSSSGLKLPCKHTHEALVAAYPPLPNAHTQRDRAASAMIRHYILNFAARGNPNGPGLPHWEKFDATTQRVMVLDDAPSSREWPNLKALQALTPYLQCFAGIPLKPGAQP